MNELTLWDPSGLCHHHSTFRLFSSSSPSPGAAQMADERNDNGAKLMMMLYTKGVALGWVGV